MPIEQADVVEDSRGQAYGSCMYTMPPVSGSGCISRDSDAEGSQPLHTKHSCRQPLGRELGVGLWRAYGNKIVFDSMFEIIFGGMLQGPRSAPSFSVLRRCVLDLELPLRWMKILNLDRV